MAGPDATEAESAAGITAVAFAVVARASRIVVWLGGFALILIALLVTLEVVLREVFLIGLSAATEVSAYVLAVSTAWAYAFALLERNHVRVDAVIRLLPPGPLIVMDLVALLALTWFAGVLLWYGGGVVGWSLETGAHAMTPLGTPLWLPQGLWVFGIAFFFATCLIVLIRTVALLLAGRRRAASDLIGTFSRQDEGAAEAEDAARRHRRERAS